MNTNELWGAQSINHMLRRNLHSGQTSLLVFRALKIESVQAYEREVCMKTIQEMPLWLTVISFWTHAQRKSLRFQGKRYIWRLKWNVPPLSAFLFAKLWQELSRHRNQHPAPAPSTSTLWEVTSPLHHLTNSEQSNLRSRWEFLGWLFGVHSWTLREKIKLKTKQTITRFSRFYQDIKTKVEKVDPTFPSWRFHFHPGHLRPKIF